MDINSDQAKGRVKEAAGDLTGNEKLKEMINSLVTRFQRLRYMSLSLPGRMKISVQEHEKIIEAFQNRDADTAAKLVQKNAEYGGRVLLDGCVTPSQAAEFG